MAPPLLLLAALAAAPVQGEVLVEGRQLFTLTQTDRSAPGSQVVERAYSDRRGRRALTVTARTKNDGAIEVQTDHRQLRTRATVNIRGRTVRYIIVRDGEEPEVQSETVAGTTPILAGPAILQFFARADVFARLSRKEMVKFRVASWERKTTYAFRVRATDASTKTQLVLQMEPDSWLLRNFVGDLLYTYDRKTRRILNYRGLMSLKRVDSDGDLSELIGELRYKYANE